MNWLGYCEYKRYIGHIMLLLVLLLALGAQAAYGAAPPDEVVSTAEEGLARFLSTIPPDELKNIGLNSSEEINAATLGQPYLQLILTPQALSSYESGQSLSDLLTETDTWLFPVRVGNEARTMLTVAKLDGKWQAGGIGGTQLSAALQQRSADVPDIAARQGLSLSPDYTVRYVRVFQVYTHLLVIQSTDGEYILPLETGPQTDTLAALPKDTLLTADQVLPALNTAVQQDLENSFGGGAPVLNPEEVLPEVQNPASSYFDGKLGIMGATFTFLAVAGGVVVVAWSRRKHL